MFNKAIKILNKNLILIIITSLLASLLFALDIFKINIGLLLFLSGLGSILYMCGVHASLWQYYTEGKYNFIKGIKDNFWRYIAALIGIGIAVGGLFLVIVMIAKGKTGFTEFMQVNKNNTIIILPASLMGLLFIYVIPYVFVKKEGIDAALDGPRYLFANFKKSLLPIGLYLASGILGILMQNDFLESPILKMGLIIFLSFIQNYLIFLVFLLCSFAINEN